MTIIFYNSTNHNDIYGLINKNKRPHGVEYALEKTEEAIQNRPRENRRGNTKSTIQRKPKRQYKIENSEKTEEAIQNRQFRENRRGNTKSTIQRHWQHRIHKTKKKKHNTTQYKH
jgi:hypothetical protein